MNTLSLILAIGATITFFGSIAQAIVAGIEIARHSVQSRQKKQWLALIVVCILFSALFGYASYYTSLSNSNNVSTSNQIPTSKFTSPIHSTPTPSVVSSPSPDPTIVPPTNIPVSPTSIPPQPGKVLYHADSTTWSSGMNGWIGSSDWTTVNGLLVNNGTGPSSSMDGEPTITAPYAPTTANYAVEARIQFVGLSSGNFTSGFGLEGRSNRGGRQGYTTWTHPSSSNFDPGFIAFALVSNIPISSGSNTQADNIDGNWHTYSLEFRGNNLTFLFDGQKIFATTDNSSLSPGLVGLASKGCQINVSNFTVTAL